MARRVETQADQLLRDAMRGEGSTNLRLPQGQFGPARSITRAQQPFAQLPQFRQDIIAGLVRQLRRPRRRARPIRAVDILGSIFRNSG